MRRESTQKTKLYLNCIIILSYFSFDSTFHGHLLPNKLSTCFKLNKWFCLHKLRCILKTTVVWFKISEILTEAYKHNITTFLNEIRNTTKHRKYPALLLEKNPSRSLAQFFSKLPLTVKFGTSGFAVVRGTNMSN